MSRLDQNNTDAQAQDLERNVDRQAQAAKQAIREYNETILRESKCDPARKLRKREAVERAVSHYIQLQKKLDQIRGPVQQ